LLNWTEHDNLFQFEIDNFANKSSFFVYEKATERDENYKSQHLASKEDKEEYFSDIIKLYPKRNKNN